MRSRVLAVRICSGAGGPSGMVYEIFFFFQAEDGIRDGRVTGVQTCALPISYFFRAVFPGRLPRLGGRRVPARRTGGGRPLLRVRPAARANPSPAAMVATAPVWSDRKSVV